MQVIKLLGALALIGIGIILFIPDVVMHVAGVDQTVDHTVEHALAIGGAFMVLFGSWWILSLFFRTPDDPTDELQYDIILEQLQKNYDQLRSQTNLAFRLSAACVLIGTATIFVGILVLFGLIEVERFPRDAGTLTTLSGVVVNMVSGIGMYLYNSTSKRMESATKSLQRTITRKMLFDEARQIPDEAERSRTLRDLYDKILGRQR